MLFTCNQPTVYHSDHSDSWSLPNDVDDPIELVWMNAK